MSKSSGSNEKLILRVWLTNIILSNILRRRDRPRKAQKKAAGVKNLLRMKKGASYGNGRNCKKRWLSNAISKRVCSISGCTFVVKTL